MIYITGDLHGDIERLKAKAVKRLKKGDSLIVCGDFGFVWDGSKAELKILKWLGKRRYNLLFVEGIHDNLELLKTFPEEDWNGGRVRVISGKLRQLIRGHVFQLEGMRILAFGGGEKEDELDEEAPPEGRIEDDLPTLQELDACRERLKGCDNQLDYIVTHQASGAVRQLMNLNSGKERVSYLHRFFDEVRGVCGFKRWFFGSTHQDKYIPPKDLSVFKNVIPIHWEPKPPERNAKKWTTR